MLRVFFKDCFLLFSSPKKQGWLAEAEVLADLGLQLFLHPAFRFIAGTAAGRQLVPAYCPLHPFDPQKESVKR